MLPEVNPPELKMVERSGIPLLERLRDWVFDFEDLDLTEVVDFSTVVEVARFDVSLSSSSSKLIWRRHIISQLALKVTMY